MLNILVKKIRKIIGLFVIVLYYKFDFLFTNNSN